MNRSKVQTRVVRRELSANHILPGRAECTDSELVPGFFDCVHLKLSTLGSNMSISGNSELYFGLMGRDQS